jgi:putative DNA primase/helicase
MTELSAADFERARTWMLDVAEALLPDTRHRDEGGDRRFLERGGLAVNRRSGAWFSHSAGRGGYSAPALVMFLKGCSADEAAAWIRAFLAAHPGTGSCDGDPDDNDDTPASAAQARDHLDALIDIIGTPSGSYARSRKLDPPYPATGHIPYARCGESGLAGILTAHGRTVGLQVLYLTPEGRKSTVTPQRRRLMREKAPGAIFVMPYSGSATDVVICEGLEDTLSVFRYGKRRCRIIGLPGVGTLLHLKFAKRIRVTIVRDGDAPDSAAAKALQDGIDRLILDDVDVYVTPTPLGSDASDMLQHSGVDALVALLDSAEPAILSLRGEIERLARLDHLDYALIRKDEVKRLGISVKVLDAEVRKARDRIAGKTKSAKPNNKFDIKDTPLWPRPVDGAELLNALVELVGSYVVMREVQCWTVSLWTLFTHCFAAANNAPKLWIKSAERRSGKTRLLEVLRHLTARALTTNYISPAMLPRVVEQYQPTLLLDEIDTFIGSSEEMRGVLNSGFDRGSFVIIGSKIGDEWVPKRFSAWCPQALAGIGNLPDTIADRSFCIEIERKLRSQKVNRLRRRDTGPLEELAQKCARWAADNLYELEDAVPDMPRGLNDRAADAWELCVAIADLSSEAWGRQARKAALEISGDGADISSIGEQLLSDIRDVFETMRGVPKKHQRIAGQDLVFKLNEMIDRPWPEFRKGMPLSQATLAHLLRPFHVTPCQLRIGGRKTRGYGRTGFEQAFARYLPPLDDGPSGASLPAPPIPPVQPGTAVYPEQSRGFEAEIEPVHGSACTTSEILENSSETAVCTDVPGANGVDGGLSRNGSEEWRTSSIPPSDVRPNGADPASRKRPRSEVEQKIIQLWREHPDWSFRKIGRECSVTHKRAQRVIAAAIAEEASA